MMPANMGLSHNRASKARAEWPSFHGSAVPQRHDAYQVAHEFVRALHHRLCQPLTALSCSLEVLQMGRESDSRLMEQLQTALSQSSRAMEILSVFRQMFEAEDPLSGIQSASLHETAAEVVADITLLAEMHGVRLETTSDGLKARVALSPKVLRQALWNIFQNCIEGSASGLVSVDITSEQMVITDGVSISQDEVRAIFDPFSYCENRKQGSRISNLPLALAQRIIRTAGGQIQVKLIDDASLHGAATEAPGIGRRFEIQFPAC